jgi:beta-glucosidase-like glycosyl hydrolase
MESRPRRLSGREGMSDDFIALLRDELAEMASTASVDMELWNRFSNRVLKAANVIEEQAVRIEDIAEKYNNALLSPVTEKMLKNAVEEIVQLKAALKPFVDMADEYDAAFPRPLNICLAEYPEDYPLWCQARAAYLGEKE